MGETMVGGVDGGEPTRHENCLKCSAQDAMCGFGIDRWKKLSLTGILTAVGKSVDSDGEFFKL